MPPFVRFLIVGALGFAIDAGLTVGLVEAGLQPWQGRAPAILSAMAFTWLVNRRFTYRPRASRKLVEAGRYATVALAMAVGNYLLFLLLLGLGLPALAAVVVATACQTVVSFWAYRRFVFGAAA